MTSSVRISRLIPILVLFLLSGGASSLLQAQDVIRASGGTDISIDNALTETFTVISGPTIRETSGGQLEANGTIALTLPAGYKWNTALTSEEITLTIEPVGAQNTNLEVSFTSIDENQAVFTVTSASTTAGAGQGPGRVTIGGLELRPTSTEVPNSGEISNSGTIGPTEVNYGNLSTESGSVDQIRVETEPDGSGEVVSDQSILAGQSLQVYAVARDAGGNFISNLALDEESDWSLVEVTGGIPQSSLEPAVNLRSAAFSPVQTGTANIRAVYDGADPNESGTITVLPRPAVSMELSVPPSTATTAGEPFPDQPALELRDQYDNLVTTDNSTEVTSVITSGDGTLLGQTAVQADEGVIEYEDLQLNTEGEVTLRFESDGLTSVDSDPITVNPTVPSALSWLEQPTNTLPGETIEPALELQLLDAYDNVVPQAGIEVTVVEEPDTEMFLAGTGTVTTNSEGIAYVDQLEIIDDEELSDENNSVQVSADFDGISQPVVSQTFYILSASSLVGFEVTAAGGGPIGGQTAGEPFDIDIRAVDGEDNTFEGFSGELELTSGSDFLVDEGSGEERAGSITVELIDGVLTGQQVSLADAGELRIHVESSEEDRSGRSNIFTLDPAGVDVAESGLEAEEDELTADGESSTELTVYLRDRYGNRLVVGGETVELTTTAGSLSAGSQENETRVIAEDMEDGSYRAELTASESLATAVISAYLGEELEGGEEIDEIQILFTAGNLDGFVISLPGEGGAPADQTAGEPFGIDVEAVDDNGNRIETYAGDVVITTSSEITDGGSATISDGLLENYMVTLTESAQSVTLTVTEDGDSGIGSTSETFRVLAAPPDPERSQVTASPILIQNDGVMESVITITLRDEWGNRVTENLLSDVSLDFQRLELEGSPASGTPSASLGSLSFHESPASYQATLTSSTTIELVELTGYMNAVEIAQRATVNIVQPNTWTPSGAPQQRTDWNRPENWSLNRVPGEEDFVIIPGGLDDYPDLDLNITIGSLLIEQLAELVLFDGGNTLEVNGQTEVNGFLNIEGGTALIQHGNLTGDGTFTGGNNVSVELYGDVSISNFLVRTTGAVIEFLGEDQQTVSVVDMLAQRLVIDNDVLFAQADLVDTDRLTMTSDNTVTLEEGANSTLDVFSEITGGGMLQLNDNTLVLGGNLDLDNADAAEATIVFGVRPGEDPEASAHLSRQQIASLSEMLNVTVNNHHGVRTFEDIVVEGVLTLENGNLIISSGRSLIAPNQVYENGELTFRRSINAVRGWRMMSTPVNTTYDDLFDGLVTQGIDNSTYPDDTIRQPSILWYDETHVGTDLQRWRKPADMENAMAAGRGYFFYVFGDEEEDPDYSDTLPYVLTASGQESQPENGMFDFEVTYTAEADTGWNLVGNPYGGAIDWDDELNWEKEHMDNVIYIWDPDASTYRTWNGITGSLGSGRIAPFHAFWVKAHVEDPEEQTPSLQVSPEAKTTGGQFLQKSGDSEETWALVLRLETDGLSSETHFSFSEDGRIGRDRRDAWYLEPMPYEENYLLFYSLSRQDEPMAIQNLPKRSRDPVEIPLGVGGYRDGEPIHGSYQISLGEETTLPDSWKVVLTDNRTGEETDLWSVEEWTARLEYFREPESGRNPARIGDLHRIEPAPLRLAEGEDAQLFGSVEHPFTLTITPDPVGEDDVPEELFLRQNYPNPFDQTTTIEFGLPEDLHQERVELVVFNILGQRVETLVSGPREAGYHEVIWDPARYASGIYLYRLRAGDEVLTNKMTYIR